MDNTRTLDRRNLLHWGVNGLGATALAVLLSQDTASAADASPKFIPKAKRAIHICLVGGLSHVDSFDYKPELRKMHGKSLHTDEQPDVFFGQIGLLRGEDWKFLPRGKSGLMISEMFPHIAEMADDLTVLRSMESKSANHTPALFLANSGFEFNGFPSMGSWISYGMGVENESLPAYVVLNDERGAPNTGASTWSSAFLPSSHQGVVLGSGEKPVRDLFPPASITRDADADTRHFIQAVNQQHLHRSGLNEALAARLKSYELAAQMQSSIPTVSSFADESPATQQLYGIHQKETADMGRRCLLGRRLLEQGVRFVQLFSGGPVAGSPRASWDAHENVKDNHTIEAGRIDQPVAALLKDLKQRGMLQDTLVLFTTEFGRTPFAQSAADQVGPGRDHNRYGFSCWMAGAGLKPGIAVGSTDDIGWKAVERPIPWHDFHATILHLFGIDHEALTFYHNGIQRRLTNVHGKVVTEALA
ncbi:DUF1501 domain-containing protein [Blastopirellula marina]|uniref:DUF1501 domain-containing protein n=1 Tax=Blastopirellula marina TaxID=124 RepID=A0A2S8F2M9_9BACT|nr:MULTISPECIES: DUF1501 domain-containing protein [Pirellulaceae]PQO26357.1 DUF1501 domain-containing protein [Blastopirellula marina]RCS44813.1 DUF1501 domain-containing protein [Bremerella cremea]